MFQREFLGETIDLGVNQPNALACALTFDAYAQDAQPSRSRRLDRLPGAIVIGRDHRGTADSDEIAEQSQLGRKIVRDVRMVIHVIAREICEAASRDADTVQPVLIETMR